MFLRFLRGEGHATSSSNVLDLQCAELCAEAVNALRYSPNRRLLKSHYTSYYELFKRQSPEIKPYFDILRNEYVNNLAMLEDEDL